MPHRSKPLTDQVLPGDEISRAERKREIDLVRKFAVTLADLPQGKLAKLDIPDELRVALTEARRLTDFNAKRRQMQVVVAALDASNITQIRLNLVRIDSMPAHAHAPVVPPSPHAELAGQLLDGGDADVFALSTRFNSSDLQTLRQSVRKARKDLDAHKPRDAAVAGIVACLERFS